MGTPENGDIHQTRAWELLATDPLAELEAATGAPYTDPKTAFDALAHVRKHDDRKRMLFSEQNDTYLDMPWQSFIRVLAQTDFIVFQGGERIDKPGRTSDWLAAADVRLKLLLTANSYDERLNHADVHGMVDAGSDRSARKAAALLLHRLQTSSGPIGETAYHFTIDGREGLRTKLAELAIADVPSIDWHQSERLHIRNNAFDAPLPDWVQQFTGPLNEAK